MTDLVLIADHAMGLAALGFAGPPLLVFAGLAALVVRERWRRRQEPSDYGSKEL